MLYPVCGYVACIWKSPQILGGQYSVPFQTAQTCYHLLSLAHTNLIRLMRLFFFLSFFLQLPGGEIFHLVILYVTSLRTQSSHKMDFLDSFFSLPHLLPVLCSADWSLQNLLLIAAGVNYFPAIQVLETNCSKTKSFYCRLY